MAKLKTLITGTNVSDRLEIQTDVMKLGFHVRFTSHAGAWGQKMYPFKEFDILDDFRKATKGKISISRQRGAGGAKQLIQNMALCDLAEIAANNEGSVNIFGADPVGTSSGIYTFNAYFTVELSNAGSIANNKSDFLVVEFEGFNGYNTYDNSYQTATIDVYSLQGSVLRDEHLKYSPISCNAEQVVEVACMSNYQVAVPRTLSKLIIFNHEGSQEEKRQDEMAIITADLCDCVYNINGIYLGNAYWRTLPIQLATKLQITLTEQGMCYLLGNKAYDQM